MADVGDHVRHGFLRRHRALSVLGLVVVLLVAGVVGAAGYLNHQIGSISRLPPLAIGGTRPAAIPGKSMNILLVGADNGDDGGPSIAQSLEHGSWQPGAHRSDTIIVLHLSADRKHADLISIPRDTLVDVDGYGKQKINASFSYGGPALLQETVEQFTQLRIDHLAIMDWNGFRDLSTALGGVRVYVAENSYDSANGTTWHQGYQTVSGQRALYYVRQRHGLPNGDFDRIRRQQNFLRSAFSEATDRGTLRNPIRLNNLLRALTRNLTVDSGMTNADIRGLAYSLRGLKQSDITYIQLPFKSFADTSVGSVVKVDVPRTRELFSDVITDDLDRYVAKYGSDDVLSAHQSVD